MSCLHSSSSKPTFSGFFGRSKSRVRFCNSSLIASAENTDKASEAIGRNSCRNDARSTRSKPLAFAIPLLHRGVATSDGEGSPVPAQAIPSPGRVRRLCRALADACRRFDDSWQGAVVGGLIVMGVFVAAPVLLPLFFGGE